MIERCEVLLRDREPFFGSYALLATGRYRLAVLLFVRALLPALAFLLDLAGQVPRPTEFNWLTNLAPGLRICPSRMLNCSLRLGHLLTCSTWRP